MDALFLRLQKGGVTSGFKSRSKRFDDFKEDPGPGPYVPKSSLVHPVPVFPQPARPEVIPVRPAVPPSIPAKSQAHGYEITPDGVRPQPPVIPGYSGVSGDTVGPGDYNPRVDFKFRSAPKTSFPKDPERTELDKVLSKRSDIPGPGYYSSLSAFDLAGSDSPMDTDFLVHLNAAKKRQLSVFESKTSRSSFQQEIERKRSQPGPGDYVIPSTIVVKQKPPAVQCFATSGERFKDEQPRSMRLHTAPGSYNVIASDFDQAKLKIMRRKKMVQRSSWAQHVGFASTTNRFQDKDINEIPPSTLYTPKVSLADTLPRPNVRAGAFGSKARRFPETRDKPQATAEQIKERELNQDIARYLAKQATPTHMGYGALGTAGSSMDSMTGPRTPKPTFSSIFAPPSESRLRPVKTPPGPAPGAYELTPAWNTAKGVLPMVPKTTHSKKVEETLPGPGTYSPPPAFGTKNKNRKNVMISTSSREWKLGGVDLPGPGEYNPAPLTGSLIRPSHNILLSDKY